MNDQVIDNDTGEVHELVPEQMSGAVAAEISQQVATAKRYPRRTDKAISTEIMSRATLDEETAAECVYSLPRAGKDITGPSVRFAEIVFASFGNMRAGARFVELDTKDPKRAAVIIEGVCIDMQMNNGQTIPVRRSITNRKGEIFNADMTNIAFSAGAAIARREAILKTVPKSIWGAAWKQVLAVLQGDVKTLAARRRSALEAFQKMGVDPAKVCEALGVAGEETITLEQMPRLIGMWTALRDGTETIESLFGRGGIAHETVKNPLQDETSVESQGQATAATAEKAADSPKTTVVESGGKPDPITSGPQAAEKVAGEGSDKPAPDVQPAAKTEQATAAAAPEGDLLGAKPYTDAEGYMSHMRDQFDAAKVRGAKTAVTEVWGATREDRANLLSPEQLDELQKDKTATLAAIKLKGEK
jgi:hypothetical protein